MGKKLKRYKVAVVLEFREEDKGLETVGKETLEKIVREVGYDLSTKTITFEIEEMDYKEVDLEKI